MNSNKTQRLVSKAVICSLKEQYTKADALFNKALSACEDDAAKAGLNYLIGCHNNRRKDHRAAAAALREAVRLYPGSADREKAGAFYELGYACRAEHEYDKAVDALKQAEQLETDEKRLTEIKTLLNETQMLTGKPMDAKKALYDCDFVIEKRAATATVCRMCAVAAAVGYDSGEDDVRTKACAFAGLKASDDLSESTRLDFFDCIITCAKIFCMTEARTGSLQGLDNAAEFAYRYVSSFTTSFGTNGPKYTGSLRSVDSITLVLLYVSRLLSKGSTDEAKKILDTLPRKNTPKGSYDDVLYRRMASSEFIALAVPYYTGKLAGNENIIDSAFNSLRKTESVNDDSSINGNKVFSIAQDAHAFGLFDLAQEMYRFGLKNADDSQSRVQLLSALSSVQSKLDDNAACIESCNKLIAALHLTEGNDKEIAKAYERLSHAQRRTGDMVGATASYDVLVDYLYADEKKYTDKDTRSEDEEKEYREFLKKADSKFYAAVDQAYNKYDYPSDYCMKLCERLCDRLDTRSTDTDTTVFAFNLLGLMYYRAGEDVNKEAATYQRASKAADKVSELTYSNTHAVILCNLAECYVRSGENDKAYDACDRAEDIFAAMDKPDVLQYATCLKQVANIYTSTENREMALKKLSRAVEELEDGDLNDKNVAIQLSNCLNARGTVYFAMDMPEEEIEDISRALLIAKKHSVNEDDLLTLYDNRGEAYERAGDLASMASDFMNVIEILERTENDENRCDNRLTRANRLLSIGTYHDLQGHAQRCLSSYRDAVSLISSVEEQMSSSNDYRALAAFAQFQLAGICENPEIKDYSGCLTAYSKSIELLNSLEDSAKKNEHLATAYASRAEFYEVFGEHALAVEDLKKAQEHKDRI